MRFDYIQISLNQTYTRTTASRVSGPFLVYSEVVNENWMKLYKQSFSASTIDGQKLHLIVSTPLFLIVIGHIQV